MASPELLLPSKYQGRPTVNFGAFMEQLWVDLGAYAQAFFPAGSTQTRHIPEDTPTGFHLHSVSKLLLVISCV